MTFGDGQHRVVRKQRDRGDWSMSRAACRTGLGPVPMSRCVGIHLISPAATRPLRQDMDTGTRPVARAPGQLPVPKSRRTQRAIIQTYSGTAGTGLCHGARAGTKACTSVPLRWTILLLIFDIPCRPSGAFHTHKKKIHRDLRRIISMNPLCCFSGAEGVGRRPIISAGLPHFQLHRA